jgi:hypothetical protein
MPLSHARLPAAVLTAAVFALSACHDPTQPLAPDVEGAPVLHAAPGPPEVISLGAPLFGLDFAPNGSLLAAVASSGILRIRDGDVSSVANLPGVNDVASIGHGAMFVVTGGSQDPSQIFPTSRKLFRVSNGRTRLVADPGRTSRPSTRMGSGTRASARSSRIHLMSPC